jgi:hypothetical protein
MPMANTNSRYINRSPLRAPYRGQNRTTANPKQAC